MTDQTNSILFGVLVFAFISVILTTPLAYPQDEIFATRTVDQAQRRAIIDKVLEMIEMNYIHEDITKKILSIVKEKYKAGKYDKFDNHKKFLSELSHDIVSISNDFHLGVWPIEWSLTSENMTREHVQWLESRARYRNHGVKTVKVLPGNIGYLELVEWMGGKNAAKAIESALRLLSNTEAIIFDLRRNGGGEGIQKDIIYSCLFKEPVHIMNVYSRRDDSLKQIWTIPTALDLEIENTPVYVLLSKRSASASEAFAYVLQNQKRAIIVGEKSRGAANPTEEFNFPELSFCMGVTAYEVRLPETGENWEGVGVKPDIAVPAQNAFCAAIVDALDKLLQKEDVDKNVMQYRKWALQRYKAELNPVNLSDDQIENYSGEFENSIRIQIIGNKLMLVVSVKAPVTLIPLGHDTFALKEEQGLLQFADYKGKKFGKIELFLEDGFKVTAERIRGE